MKRFIFFMALFFMIFFYATSWISACKQRPSEKEKLVTEIQNNTAKKLKNEMDLRPFGFGGRMMNEIKKLSLAFEHYQPLELPEARKMLVRAAQIFINEINSHEKVRPYLIKYPFDAKNVEIIIIFRNPDGSKVDRENLTVVACRDGNLEYEIHETDSNIVSTVHEETFEQALQKI